MPADPHPPAAGPRPPQDGTGDLHWSAPVAETGADGTAFTFTTRLPPDYAHFAGHFPDYPVLAGAVQLHELVLPCLARAAPDAGTPTGLAGVKFPARIVPGDELTVRLVLPAGSPPVRFGVRFGVRFEICRQGRTCTRGTLLFGPCDAGPPT